MNHDRVFFVQRSTISPSAVFVTSTNEYYMCIGIPESCASSMYNVPSQPFLVPSYCLLCSLTIFIYPWLFKSLRFVVATHPFSTPLFL